MKVNPRHILSHWKKGVLHALLTLSALTIGACDFDIPDKFEMPTWYLDLKIPLVQTRYQMSDISDSTAGIFLTDDSLGFKIIQEGIGQRGCVPGHQFENCLGAGMAIALGMAKMMKMERIEILCNASQCRHLGVLWPRSIKSNLGFFLIKPMALSFGFPQRVR